MEKIKYGVISQGRVERYFAMIRRLLRLIHSRRRTEQVFEQSSLKAHDVSIMIIGTPPDGAPYFPWHIRSYWIGCSIPIFIGMSMAAGCRGACASRPHGA